MPRPKISDDNIEAMETWLKPNLKVDMDRLSTDEKLGLLLAQHRELHDFKLRYTKGGDASKPSAPSITTPRSDQQYDEDTSHIY